ncbi:MAG: hypothetical protein JXR58_13655 [Bacteroidales bacterium]|nr:hypothetical protein [Bacteroidales bacterium]
MRIIFFISIIILFFSCKKEESVPIPEIDYSYLPLDTGVYFVYQIEEIEIDSALSYYDTVRYQLKTVFESYYSDAEGNNAIRVERYKRNSSLQNWSVSDVWSANYKNGTVQFVEENMRFVKMVYPSSINKTWDGNAYNIYDKEMYTITSIDAPAIINSLAFDSVLTVTQLYDTTLLYKYFKVEKYAKNIGLIYKIDMNVESQNITFPNVPVENRITSGTIFTQKLIEYGYE